jgi:hypothetical protein
MTYLNSDVRVFTHFFVKKSMRKIQIDFPFGASVNKNAVD